MWWLGAEKKRLRRWFVDASQEAEAVNEIYNTLTLGVSNNVDGAHCWLRDGSFVVPNMAVKLWVVVAPIQD